LYRYGPNGSVRLKGLAELQRSLSKVNRGAAKRVRDELRDVAEPIRSDAEHRAGAEIRNIGPRWGRMKIGARTRSVYIAPATRPGRGSPRPNLGRLLLSRAMLPALNSRRRQVERRVEAALDRLTREAGL
jgi:hypothetical protein